MAWKISGIAILLLFVWFLTAGGSETSGETSLSLSGQVIFRGQVVHSGTIVFTADPQRGAGDSTASGQLHSDGQFTLTGNHGEGIRPGWYRITVTGQVGYGTYARAIPSNYQHPEHSTMLYQVRGQQRIYLDVKLD